MDHLEVRIKAEAKCLGFSFIGITSPNQTAHFGHYLKWIEEQKNAGLEYLAMEYVAKGRRDPSSLLAGARSMIVGGIHYQPQMTISDLSRECDPGIGWIASYGTLPDYHETLKQLFRSLGSVLHELTNSAVKSRIFIDSGPVMEKDFAMQAGLGWIGKNSLLITPDFGSYCLIGCMMTDLELPMDEPFSTDLCGDCTACIQACPTGCISMDKTIDAGRCISYLTVETQQPFTMELKKEINGWIFGCDICQLVCPINREVFIKNRDSSASVTEPVISQRVWLNEEKRLSSRKFDEKYSSTPVQRIGHQIYKRNITNSLANQLMN
jgi:epoxyqueuosine reductase